jgi:hypothetical protein
MTQETTTQAEITRRVRAELESGQIPFTTLNNNTVEARGRFVTTVIGIEPTFNGDEHVRVRVFVDGHPRCAFGFDPEEIFPNGD